MKKQLYLIAFLIVMAPALMAQEIQTIFRNPSPSGGYAGISNKFSMINDDYANIVEVYGGWFVKRRLLLGIGAAASTNYIPVPAEYRMAPVNRMSWQYGQFGFMTEYVFASNRVVHVNLTLFAGAGFTLQYERPRYDDWDSWDHYPDVDHDEDFFQVLEPGAQVEVNILKWLRLSPGVSYRKTFGSDGFGLSDNKLSNWSYNITLKVGKF